MQTNGATHTTSKITNANKKQMLASQFWFLVFCLCFVSHSEQK